MYITYIKDTEQRRNARITQDFVDALFNGTELPEMEVNTITEVSKLYRTNTVVVEPDEIITDSVTPEQWRTASVLIKNRVAGHDNPEDEYETFRIPKKTHGFREINAPKIELKKDQKEIAKILEHYLRIRCHDSAWAYIPGRDVVHAMEEHINNKSRWYLKIDLHNFFGSCSPEFIKTQLKKIYPFGKYDSDEVIDDIIKIATLNEGLPQGTPLSPILTNLIMVDFDYRINRMLYKLTKENLLKQKYIYTRYADDIIISAKNKFDYNIIVNGLRNLFEGTPLVINGDKTRFGSSSGRNWNLGIMCNKDNKMTIGYRRKQQLKCIVHNYITYRSNIDEWQLRDLYWLQGQLSWLQNVESNYFEGFKQYIRDKYQIDLIQTLLADIKRLSSMN